MGVFVKICGLTREADIDAVCALRPDAIGFVFWPKSKRAVRPEDVALWTAGIPESILKVGVFVDDPPERISEIVEAAGLGAVQLHGFRGLEIVPFSCFEEFGEGPPPACPAGEPVHGQKAEPPSQPEPGKSERGPQDTDFAPVGLRSSSQPARVGSERSLLPGKPAGGVWREPKNKEMGRSQRLGKRNGAFPIIGKSGAPVRTWQVVHLAKGAPQGGAGFVDAYLLDSYSEQSPGGTGKTCDWQAAASFVQTSSKPVVLAGGLTPENVAEAIRVVRPWGVDVSSGVEAAPGRKDMDKVRRFIESCRRS